MAARQQRTHNWQEAQANVHRAKQLAERYGLDESNPADFIPPSDEQDYWDDLLSQIK